ncbi:MAG: TIGR04013 family B12-binding domain/radical SAM domain-containing protein [Candidatus Hermodarchaeota archaeon]
MDSSVVFRRRSKNWFSFPPLISALGTIFPKITIKVLKTYLDPGLSSTSYGSIIFCDSFQSPSASQIGKEVEQAKNHFIHQKMKPYFIAGGPHASGDPEGTLGLGFDIVVVGEGELVLPQIINCLSKCKKEDPSTKLGKIEGIFFRDEDNNIVKTPPNNTKVELDNYLPYSPDPPLHPPIEITRACPFACTYCQVSFLFGRRMRHRSIEQINNIVDYYVKRFSNQKQVDIRFITPNAFSYGAKDKKPDFSKVERLIGSLKTNFAHIRLFMGSFPSEIRPEFITEESFPLLSKLNNKIIAIGAQSGSNRILDLINRGHSTSAVIQAVNLINQAQKTAIVDFILGLPQETRDDQFETLAFAKTLIAKKAKIRFHHFLPLPGTPLANTRPSPIDSELLLEIGRLTTKGHILGSFDLQRRLTIH